MHTKSAYNSFHGLYMQQYQIRSHEKPHPTLSTVFIVLYLEFLFTIVFLTKFIQYRL